MSLPVGKTLEMLYDLLKLINKDKSEKFEKEWTNDKQELLRCIEAGDAECVNRFIAWYFNL